MKDQLLTDVTDLVQAQGIRERPNAKRLANYIVQELRKAKYSGKSKDTRRALLNMGERALKEQTQGKKNSKMLSGIMQKVWLNHYSAYPEKVREDKTVKALYSRISDNHLRNFVRANLTAPSKEAIGQRLQLRKNIDAETGQKTLQFEPTTQKQAGLRPDQVKNKEKLVPKDIKSNVSSKQGAIWEEAKNYGVDPEVEQRARARRNAEIDLRPSLGTEKLSRFVRRKQMKFKPTRQARGQKGADLGALVSGQKILE